VPRKKMTGWSTAHDIIESWVDTEDVVTGLLQRKLEDLRQRLASWLPERREATVRDVLWLARKLHHAAYAVWPGRYLFQRFLRLVNLHLRIN